MQDNLKLGFFIQPVHPPARVYAEVLREDREAVVLADRLGYREAFIGEHLVDAAETITSCLAFIAHLADACPSITFGTGVLPLANYPPAMAAAQIAMVDHLVQGRFILGFGPGVPGDAEAIGDVGSDRNRKAQDAIDQILRIWSDGEFFRTVMTRTYNPEIGVGIAARPLQRPHPPIAITSIRPGGAGPGAAGRRGWTGISATYVAPHVVRAHVRGYVEGRRSAGLSADASGWRVARSIFVADDEDTARRHSPQDFYFQVMRTKLARSGTVDVMGGASLVLAGTPENVAGQILAFRRDVGPFGTLLYTGHDWVDPALARRSMELMAREVMPRVNRALA